jgi:SpoVK/Ycf46/Vps4 family AAA+-type ATPase
MSSIRKMEKNINFESPKMKKTLREYSNNPEYRPEIPVDAEKGFPLLRLSREYFSFSDLILTKELKEQLEYVITENKITSRFYELGLKPKQKILFCGPPGTGKTLASKVVSSVTGFPFVYVMFDSIVSSFLGETATNLRKIFNFIENGRYVVLFDEFDIVGKKRDDPNEHGEIKRVVNNFMQMLDSYDGDSILIFATNHQQMLDTAIWRRFDEILFFDLPDTKQRKQLFKKYLSILKKSEEINFSSLARRTKDYSGAEISQICADSIRKAIVSDRNEINLNDLKWALSEQKRRKQIIKN